MIAIAHKSLSSDKELPREEVECNLELVGLIIMENLLKPESEPTIDALQSAKIMTLMATGDNGLTAVSVG